FAAEAALISAEQALHYRSRAAEQARLALAAARDPEPGTPAPAASEVMALEGKSVAAEVEKRQAASRVGNARQKLDAAKTAWREVVTTITSEVQYELLLAATNRISW